MRLRYAKLADKLSTGANLTLAELIALLPGVLERRLSHTEALQELIASREALQKEFDMQLVEQSPRQCRTAE